MVLIHEVAGLLLDVCSLKLFRISLQIYIRVVSKHRVHSWNSLRSKYLTEKSDLTLRGILLPKNNLVKMVMTQAGTQHNTKAKTTLNQERKLISRISFEVTLSLLFVRRLCVASYYLPESSAKRFCS